MKIRQKIVLYIALLALLFPQWTSAFGSESSPAQQSTAEPIVELTASSAAETVFKVSTPAYSLQSISTEFGSCTRVSVPGLDQSGAIGGPQLPAKTVLLGVPPGASLSVTTQSAETVAVSLAAPLCPAPEPVAEEGENGVVHYIEKNVPPDPALYGQTGPVPAQIATVAEFGYQRSQRLARVSIAPFQYNPTSASLTYTPELTVRVQHESFGAFAASRRSAPEPDVFENSLRSTLLNYATAKNWRSTAAVRPAAAGWQPPSPSYRVIIDEEGLYAISYEELGAAGVPVASINQRGYRLFLDGQEISLRMVDASGQDDTDGTFGPGDRMLFYGISAIDKYADTNVYWLTYGPTSGIRMVKKPNYSNYDAPHITDYVASSVNEENLSYVSAAPKLPGYEHWYGRQVAAFGSGNSSQQHYVMEVSDIVSTETASLSLSLAARTRGEHNLRIYVNNTLVHTTTWSGPIYHTTTGEFDQSLLSNGKNLVTLEIVNDQLFQTVSVAYVDRLALNYKRQLQAIDDRLIFDSPGSGSYRFTVQGFRSNRVELYDITNTYRPARVDAGAYAGSLSFGVNESESRRYLLDTPASWRSPVGIELADTPNLLASSNGADYLILSHENFLPAIQPLAEYRASQGYRVKIVDVQHIYDLFSFGRQSADAIRDFLAFAYENWSGEAPAFVLLVGDGTYDPRGYLETSKPTFIPPFLEMVDPDLGETAADNRFVAIAGDDNVPDMHLGRLPVNTPEEAAIMVQKTIRYEQVPINDGWNRNVLFVTDDLGNGGGAFYNFSDAVAEGTIGTRDGEVPVLPLSYNKIKAYMGKDCEAEECKRRIMNALNAGTLLVSYVGHSAKETWAAEKLLSIPALEQLNNSDRLPVMLPMTCLEGYYQQADADTLAESIVRLDGKGAVASWSATGLGLVTGHDYLERGFFLATFYQDVQEAGAAATAGKLFLAANAPPGKYDDLLDTFVFLGDPAVRLRLPGGEAGDGYKMYLPALNKNN